jgi:hypothetical protein
VNTGIKGETQMKKVTCFILTAVVLTASPVFSQSENNTAKFSMGIVGGLNLTNMYFPNAQGPDDQRTTSLQRWAAGMVLDIRLGKNLSARIEPMYLQKGCNIEEGSDPVNQPPGKINVSALEIPLLIQYTFGNQLKPYLIAGASVGYNLTSELDFEMTGLEFKGDLDSVTERLDLGLTFGGGIQFPIGCATFFLEGRYTFGLINQRKSGTATLVSSVIEIEIDSDKEDDQYFNRGFQLLAGFTIPIGK